jgi:hypothetical protein
MGAGTAVAASRNAASAGSYFVESAVSMGVESWKPRQVQIASSAWIEHARRIAVSPTIGK